MRAAVARRLFAAALGRRVPRRVGLSGTSSGAIAEPRALVSPVAPPPSFWSGAAPGDARDSTWDGSSGPPMVWHPRYSIPWPANHRFAMWKFDDLRLEAVRASIVASESDFFTPSAAEEEALDATLPLAHCAAYYAAFANDTMEPKLWRRVGFGQRPDHAALVARTRLEAAGTLMASRLALEHGIACNLGGGTHHAHRDYGAGYTVINDLAIAALAHIADQRALGQRASVVIVDLDVHQGDGTASILANEPDAFTLSMHCGVNYPFGFNKTALPYLGDDASDLDLALPANAGDEEVLAQLRAHLPAVLDATKPTLVLFDAGADMHATDALGKLDVTDGGMFKRDCFVLAECVRRSIPVATVIGGGYDADRDRLAKRHATVLHAATRVWRSHLLLGRGAAARS